MLRQSQTARLKNIRFICDKKIAVTHKKHTSSLISLENSKPQNINNRFNTVNA